MQKGIPNPRIIRAITYMATGNYQRCHRNDQSRANTSIGEALDEGPNQAHA
jgi:hypothetical protein